MSKPQLKVVSEQEMIFVHPILATDDAPAEDSLVRGTVFLSLPKNKAIARITVALEGLCDAYGEDRYRPRALGTTGRMGC